MFDRFDDVAEGRVATHTFGLDFERAGLIHAAGKYTTARSHVDGQRLARDRRLVNRRFAVNHDAIDRKPTARPDQHADRQHAIVDRHFDELTVTANMDLPGQELEELSNRATSTRHREMFQDLRGENKPVINSAVNTSPIASAATSAIVIDSSIVMRRSTMLSIASLNIG